MEGVAADPISATPSLAFLTDVDAHILHFAAEAHEQGYGAALATLVEIRGGSARALGAHMAVRSDGLYCGFVSGGCTEAAVAAEAMTAISSGNDRFVMLGEGSPFFDIVLPCGGGITIAIHVLRDTQALRSVLSAVQGRRRTALRYSPGKQQIWVDMSAASTGWENESFVTRYRPQTRVFLSGRSIELETTRTIAHAAGYDVYCHSPGEPLPQETIDQDTAVALLYHDLDREVPVLVAALRSKSFYLGALGSHRTHEKRKQALIRQGVSEMEIARITAPIGVFNKARSAQTLALSVLADIARAETQNLSESTDEPKARLGSVSTIRA